MPTFSSSLVTRPEIHGHRGCRGLLPENTLPAFLHALALGAEVLEMDVVISADQQVVVSHEPWLSAQLGTGPQGEAILPANERAYNLYRLPYATIRRCLVGMLPHPGFPAQRPSPSYRPLLREVLAATEAACQQMGRPPVGYSVELKSSLAGDNTFHPRPAPFVALVQAELAAANVQSRTTILSFDTRILQATRQHTPAQALCLLFEGTPIPVTTVFDAVGFVPDTFGPDFQLLSAELIQNLSTAYPALRLVPWTINNPSDLRNAALWGFAGITTDYPDRLLALLTASDL